MGLRGEHVLSLALHAFGLAVTLRSKAHGDIVEGAGEPVEHHRVDDRLVTDAHPASRVREKVGRVGHRLHATGDNDVGVTHGDHAVGLDDGVEAREAHLVDHRRRNAHRDPSLHRRLTSWDLSGSSEKHLAHDHVVDLITGDSRPRQGGRNGVATEVGGGKSGERTGQFADGGAGTGDDDGSRHGNSSS